MDAPPPIGDGNWHSGTLRLAWGLLGRAEMRVDHGSATIVRIGGVLRWVTGVTAIQKGRGEVQVSHVRLRPPWASTVVHLDRTTSFIVGSRTGRRLVEQLSAEGFVVEFERAWLWPSVRTDLRDAQRVESDPASDGSRLRWYRLLQAVVAGYALFGVAVPRIF